MPAPSPASLDLLVLPGLYVLDQVLGLDAKNNQLRLRRGGSFV